MGERDPVRTDLPEIVKIEIENLGSAKEWFYRFDNKASTRKGQLHAGTRILIRKMISNKFPFTRQGLSDEE